LWPKINETLVEIEAGKVVEAHHRQSVLGIDIEQVAKNSLFSRKACETNSYEQLACKLA